MTQKDRSPKRRKNDSHKMQQEGSSIAQIDVTINGASRSARLSWAGSPISLTDMGGGTFAASFNRNPGTYIYSIVVFGDPGDPWTAKVTDQHTTQNFAGHMSRSGTDTTGDTAFTVQS